MSSGCLDAPKSSTQPSQLQHLLLETASAVSRGGFAPTISPHASESAFRIHISGPSLGPTLSGTVSWARLGEFRSALVCRVRGLNGC